MPDEPQHPIYRRRRDASEYLRNRFSLNCAVGTLAKYATIGGGPRFVHAGRFPLYPETELDAWALSRISSLKSSTSDTESADPVAVPEKPVAADCDGTNSPTPPPGPPFRQPHDSRLHGRRRSRQNPDFSTRRRCAGRASLIDGVNNAGDPREPLISSDRERRQAVFEPQAAADA